MSNIRRSKRCPQCRSLGERSVAHDAFFCRTCDIWLEPVCTAPAGDPCIYCEGRPDRPGKLIPEDFRPQPQPTIPQ